MAKDNFWTGLLQGWGSTFPQALRDAREQEIKDRQYEWEKKKFDEEQRLKKEQQDMLRSYYESGTKLHNAQSQQIEQKTGLLKDLKPIDDGLGSPVNTSTPPVKPTSYNTENIPWVAEESGGRPDAVNPKDGKSASFGLIQANAPETQEMMLRKSGIVYDDPQTGQRVSWLPNNDPRSPEYQNAFKTYVNQDPQRHAKAQLETAHELYTKPMLVIGQKYGLDVSIPEVEKALTSASIQHGVGGANNLIDLSIKNGDFSTPAKAISSLYDARSAAYPKFADRYQREKVALLASLEKRNTQVSSAEPQVSPGSPQVASEALPNGSYQVAASPTTSMTDAPNGYGQPGSPQSDGPTLNLPQGQQGSKLDAAKANAAQNRLYANVPMDQLAKAIEAHTNRSAIFQSNGLHYPDQGKLNLLQDEFKARREQDSREQDLAMRQPPKKYIDLSTGEVRLMNSLDLSKVADPSSFQEYNDNPQGLESRIKQGETAISNLTQRIISDPSNAQYFQGKSPEEQQRIALAVVAKQKPELVRSFYQDLEKYRTIPGISISGEDDKKNKILVETRYAPTTEALAGNLAEVQQYNKVGNDKVKSSFNTLASIIEPKKQEFMSAGLSETEALEKAKEFARSTAEGKQAYDIIDQAYNGSEAPIKSGRITTIGNRTMTKGQEKELEALHKQNAEFEQSTANLKDSLSTPEEKAQGKILTDEEMKTRAGEMLKTSVKLGTRASELLSNFIESGNVDILKQNGFDERTSRFYQNLREYFVTKRHDITGAAFTKQEADYLAKTFASAESSPQTAMAAIDNSLYRYRLNKDKIDYVKKNGLDGYDYNEGMKRVNEKFQKPKEEAKPAAQSSGLPVYIY